MQPAGRQIQVDGAKTKSREEKLLFNTDTEAANIGWSSYRVG